MELIGGNRGITYDRDFWGAVFELYEHAFKGLPAGIARAEAVGARWARVTTPFAFFENGRCLAHVGVTSHPMRLGGAEPVRLAGMLDDALWYLPEHDSVVIFGEEEGETLVVEVIARRLPPAAVVAGAAPTTRRALRYAFTPDRFDPGAQLFATPAAHGSFMVRGPWPLDQPFGISPVWGH